MSDDQKFDGTPGGRQVSRDPNIQISRGIFERRLTRGRRPQSGRQHLRLVEPALGEAVVADDWDAIAEVSPGPASPLRVRPGLMEEDEVAASFNQLRTSLLKSLRSEGYSRIAVSAPTSGCGTTFCTAQLALSLARTPGLRTVVLDMNLRRPGLARELDMPGGGDIPGFLAGEVRPSDHLVRVGNQLALGLGQGPEPEADHLMVSEEAAYAVGNLMDRMTPDVLICDMPPVLEQDDLSAFLPQIDGVLLVADATQTLPEHIAACERVLLGQTRVLGVVLNQARRRHASPVYC